VNSDNMEALGRLADKVDSLAHALQLPLPPMIHMQALKEALPTVVMELRAIYVAEAGNDPWAKGTE
jgi:hypothetical protein